MSTEYEQRKKMESKLAEYLADPTQVRFPFKLDYAEAAIVFQVLKRVHALHWWAEVKCAGGWMVCGAFSDEAAAWQFGERHFDVRMWKGEKLLGIKKNGGPWQEPTEEDLRELEG